MVVAVIGMLAGAYVQLKVLAAPPAAVPN